MVLELESRSTRHFCLEKSLGGDYETVARRTARWVCIAQFVNAFAKLGKATIRFVMSIRLSVRIEQFRSHWKNLKEI
jgi:hypothetical protein